MLTDLSSERGKLGSALMGLELRQKDDGVDGDGDGEEVQNHHCDHHHLNHDHHISLHTHGIRASPQ